MAAELNVLCAGRQYRRIAELGAGDGTFLLRVARKLGPQWEGTTAVLVDRKDAVTTATRKNFDQLGWQIEVAPADVFAWMDRHGHEIRDVIIANLFLHHFSESQLTGLFQKAASEARAFIAVEPRRWPWALFFGRLLWLIGCSKVTRHDAVVSIRAGFAKGELTKLWPANGEWRLEERAENFASHLFVAKRGAPTHAAMSGS
jgi:hypothetical protein